MTRSTGRREYRACIRCRSRKTRCDLKSSGEPGKPPCAKCVREGANCVLAGSRRGGDYSQYRQQQRGSLPKSSPNHGGQSVTPKAVGHTMTEGLSSSPGTSRATARDDEAPQALQNPTDALLILAHAAGGDGQSEEDCSDTGVTGCGPVDDNTAYPLSREPGERQWQISRNSRRGKLVENLPQKPPYDPLADGVIDEPQICHLLLHYAQHYHPFFPIVSTTVLQPDNLATTLQDEQILLTAILSIASSERPELAALNTLVWEHMKQNILNIALGHGSVLSIGSVEALLLLGEWTPSPSEGGKDGGGESAAWSLIGLAVRLAYRLRLDESSFKGDGEQNDSGAERRRLAWTFTYLLDRQISIRMGQAFWCRGPGLSSRFRAEDFPALQPARPYDTDYASLLQAHVELTTLFGNSHDILFASKQRTADLMRRGDYVKYLDDSMRATTAWQATWQELAIPSHLQSCLKLMGLYLRLYINGFAFQATLYKSTVDQTKAADVSFRDSAMAEGSARYIYEAVEGAEEILTTLVDEFSPEQHLRYMPGRFYLYAIHSAVFLHKAQVAGVTGSKFTDNSLLIDRFISALTDAATDKNHICARYAKLVQGLWLRRMSSMGRDGGTEDETTALLPHDVVPSVPGLEASMDLACDPGMIPYLTTPTLDDFSFPIVEDFIHFKGMWSLPSV